MKIYAFFAEGCEEVEGLTIVDICRRAGMDVEMVSITDSKSVTSSHGITFMTDSVIGEIDFSKGDMIFLPGGMPGTLNLGACELLCKEIKNYYAEGKRLAAVCAAPSVFGKLGILEGKRATSYPGFEDQLLGAEVVQNEVVTDGTVTTSRGLGTCIPLGLEIVSLVQGAEKAQDLAEKIQYFKGKN